MGLTPFYGARVEKKTQKADFAMKQTNICHLSGDINNKNPTETKTTATTNITTSNSVQKLIYPNL